MTKLIVVFRNFANAPKKVIPVLWGVARGEASDAAVPSSRIQGAANLVQK
jgi:hypothetical protein